MSKNLGDPRPSQLPKTRSTIKMPKATKVTPPKGRILRDGKILFCIWEGEPEGQEPERPYSNPLVEDMIDGLRELEEKVKQERKEQMDKDKKKLKRKMKDE